MKSLKIPGLLAGLSLLGASQLCAQVSQYGVQFQGRESNNTTPCPGLLQTDVTGVVPQGNWNPIDNYFGGLGPTADVGNSGTLWDSNLVSSASVTLDFAGNDSWFNDVTPGSVTNPIAIMYNGILKASASGGVPAVFTFQNVPEGQYDLYVYGSMNGDNTIAQAWDFDHIYTYYWREQHQVTDTSTFVQSTATTLAAATNIANYVKFSNLGTYGRGQIGASVAWVSGNDGIGVSGLQLVPAGPAQVNTTPLSFLVEPISRRGAVNYSNVTFTVTARGPAFSIQWSKNGTAVAGATSTSYTPAPIASGDNLANISVTLTNNLNSITSTNAVLTVGQYITNNGVGVLDGGIVTLTTQPQSVTVIAHRTGAVGFSVAGTSAFKGDASSAAPPITYQWQSAPKGSSAFTAIAGETNATYLAPVPSLTDDGTQFRAVVTASDAVVNSSTAVLTVLPNTIPPSVLSAAVLPGSTQVGLTFDEALDPVSAGTAANYKINGAAVAAVIMRTNVANELTSEQNLVALVAASPISGPFTVTVTGLKDPDGNVLVSTNATGTLLGLTFTEIGSTLTSSGVGAKGDGTGTNALGNVVAPDPLLPGVVTNWGSGNFDVLANGNDYWNDADGLDFLYEAKTNSFDVRVQVVSVEGINNWSAGALMMREGPVTPQGGGWELARHYMCKTDYGGPTATEDASGSGANTYEFNTRLATGNPALREGGGAQGSNNGNTNNAGFSYGWGGAGPGNPSPVPFPNAWIRIARVKSVSNNLTNDHLMGYSSTDGTNWSLREDVDLMDANHAGWLDITGKPAGPWPDVTYVGLASVSHTGLGNGNPTNSVTGQPYQAWIVYRNFGDTPTVIVPTNPTVSAQHNADGSVTLTYTDNLYSSTTANGTYTKVAGASSPFKVTPTASPAATFYKAGP